MMTCKEFVDFLMAYMDRELDPAERAEFERHLVDCPPCHVYLDTYRRTVELGAEICADEDDPVPDDVPEELVQAILAVRRSGEGSGR